VAMVVGFGLGIHLAQISDLVSYFQQTHTGTLGNRKAN
jgi:hypothetical protein